MAHVEQACRSTKYHSHSAAAQMSGAQPRRECLAVHARQLAVEPCIQILYRYPRSLLLRMEQPHRSAMAHHVTRSARLGAPVSIIESWYKGLVRSRHAKIHRLQECLLPFRSREQFQSVAGDGAVMPRALDSVFQCAVLAQ